jgi:hypothetical protein
MRPRSDLRWNCPMPIPLKNPVLDEMSSAADGSPSKRAR